MERDKKSTAQRITESALVWAMAAILAALIGGELAGTARDNLKAAESALAAANDEKGN